MIKEATVNPAGMISPIFKENNRIRNNSNLRKSFEITKAQYLNIKIKNESNE